MNPLIGTHAARAIAAKLGETSKGDTQVAVEFEITDLPDGPRRITWYGFFTEKTEDRTIEALRICGWTGTDFTDMQVGADVSLVIEDDTWEGKTRAKVKWVNRPGGIAMAKPMDAAKAAAFSARMKGKLLAFDQAAGTKQAAPSKPPDAPADIPF